MIRGSLSKTLDHDPHFRWRGEAVTRIENLSDIVFALAMGMIILSSNIPQTFEDLQAFLFNIIPAFASFILLLQIWHGHFTFFRRFGVADGRIILFNVILLFFVLFAAYPLRFAFESFFAFVTGPLDNYQRATAMHLNFQRSGLILSYFAMGYAAINACFVFMYRHAIKKADVLELSESEMILSRGTLAMYSFMTLLCILVAMVCQINPIYGFGGWLLVLNWPFGAWLARKYNPEKAASTEGHS
jgi:uncharacterized membrane protein